MNLKDLGESVMTNRDNASSFAKRISEEAQNLSAWVTDNRAGPGGEAGSFIAPYFHSFIFH